jgi:hypothetical protein
VDRAYTITAPLIQLYAERSQQISFTVETPTHVLLYDLEWCDDKYVRICNARCCQLFEHSYNRFALIGTPLRLSIAIDIHPARSPQSRADRSSLLGPTAWTICPA